MPIRLHQFLRAFLLSLAVSCFACHFLAGSGLERSAFTTVLESFAKPPWLISGTGTVRDPWKVRLTSATGQSGRALRPLPPMVLLSDDLDGVFQSNPPSPVDVAVLLRNFQRFGVKSAGCSIPLAWNQPDPLALSALEQVLGGFDSWISATPLSRRPQPEPLPPAIRRASLSYQQVNGDIAALPVVNSVPLPGVVLGGESSLAGFSSLDAEPSSSASWLLARWDDRIIPSFAVLSVCQQLGLDVSGIRVKLGETLQFSPDGPTLPIDGFGKLAVAPEPVVPSASCAAEALIDAAQAPLPVTSALPWLLADARTNADPGSLSHARTLSASVSALLNEGGLGEPESFHRLPLMWEILLLLLVSCVLGGVAVTPSPLMRWLALVLTSMICLALPYLAIGWTHWWLPALPMIAALFPAFCVQTVATLSQRSAPQESTR